VELDVTDAEETLGPVDVAHQVGRMHIGDVAELGGDLLGALHHQVGDRDPHGVAAHLGLTVELEGLVLQVEVQPGERFGPLWVLEELRRPAP